MTLVDKSMNIHNSKCSDIQCSVINNNAVHVYIHFLYVKYFYKHIYQYRQSIITLVLECLRNQYAYKFNLQLQTSTPNVFFHCNTKRRHE